METKISSPLSPKTAKSGKSIHDESKSNTPHTQFPTFNQLNDSADFRLALNQARVNKLYGDVYLTCDNVHLPAHKIVLSAKSKYFQEIFNCDTEETCTEVLVLQGVDPIVMESLLEFMYTGDINWQSVPPNKIQRLVMAGVRLCINNFCAYCISKIVEHLSGTTFRNAFEVAEILKSGEMEQQIINYVSDNLENLWISTDLMLLSERRMAAVLTVASSRVRTHDIVLRSLLAWVKHNADVRVRALWSLMSIINLPKVSVTYARFLLDEDPIVRDNIEIRDHIVNLIHNKTESKDHPIANIVSPSRQTLPDTQLAGDADRTLHFTTRKDISANPTLSLAELHDPANLATTSSCRGVDYTVTKPSSPCLVVIGTDEWNKLCICYYNIKTDQWTEAEILEVNVSVRAGLLYDRHSVFFIGGEDAQQFKLTKCYARNILQRETRRLPDLRIPRSSPVVFMVGSGLYVAGGAGRYSNTGLSHVEWLDTTQSPVWKNGQSMREKRDMTASSAVVKGHKAYVVGGGTNKCEFFSYVSRTWNEMPSLPPDFKDIPCHLAIADERLYVMKQFNPNKVYYLDQNKGMWRTQITKGIAPEFITYVAGWTTKVFALDKSLNVSVFDVVTTTWYQVTRMSRAISNVRYLTID